MLFQIYLLFISFSISTPIEMLITDAQYSEWGSLYTEYCELKSISSNFRKIPKHNLRWQFEHLMDKTVKFFTDNPLAGFAALEAHSGEIGLVLLILKIVACEGIRTWEFTKLQYLFKKHPIGEVEIKFRQELISTVAIYLHAVQQPDLLRILIRICEKLQREHYFYDYQPLLTFLAQRKGELNGSVYRPFLGVSSENKLLDLSSNVTYFVKSGKPVCYLLNHFVERFKTCQIWHFSLYLGLKYLLDKRAELIVILINCLHSNSAGILTIFRAFYGVTRDIEAIKKLTKKAQTLLEEHLEIISQWQPDQDIRVTNEILKKLALFSNKINARLD
jgi:hypothetical protein